LTDKVFALWSAPLEHFRLDGWFIGHSPPLLKLLQGHSAVPALAASRQVATPACGRVCVLQFMPATDDPGAPFE
jgi:hypothetical protein